MGVVLDHEVLRLGKLRADLAGRRGSEHRIGLVETHQDDAAGPHAVGKDIGGALHVRPQSGPMVQVEAVASPAVHELRDQFARGVRKRRCDAADVNQVGLWRELELPAVEPGRRRANAEPGGVAAVVLHPRLARGEGRWGGPFRHRVP